MGLAAPHSAFIVKEEEGSGGETGPGVEGKQDLE